MKFIANVSGNVCNINNNFFKNHAIVSTFLTLYFCFNTFYKRFAKSHNEKGSRLYFISCYCNIIQQL